MGVEDVLPGLTPSQGLLSGVSAQVFRNLTQNLLDTKMDLSVPVIGGGASDNFSLNLTKCSMDVPEQLSDMVEVLGISDLHLMPTEVNVVLESCAAVFKEAGASEVNARNLTWAIVRNILKWCGKLSDILALGHFHHSKYYGPSAEEFEDIRPAWVHFMEDHPDSDLAQKPQVLAYIGQMASWTASYVSMALDDVNERVKELEGLKSSMKEDPLDDPQIGHAWRMYVLRACFNPMNLDNVLMEIVDTVPKLQQFLAKVEVKGKGHRGFQLPPENEDGTETPRMYIAFDPEFQGFNHLMVLGQTVEGRTVKWHDAAQG